MARGEPSELTKLKIKTANLRSAAEVAQLKYEDAQRALNEMLTELESADDSRGLHGEELANFLLREAGK